MNLEETNYGEVPRKEIDSGKRFFPEAAASERKALLHRSKSWDYA
jgi:hypothetical protein